eukprot:4227168-Alexandrium_andersonii.AAC.1
MLRARLRVAAWRLRCSLCLGRCASVVSGPAGRLRRCWPGPRVGPRTAGDIGHSLGPSFAGG